MEKYFEKLAIDESINAARNALENNGIRVILAENMQEAKQAVLDMIPAGAEIMTMTSVTLDSFDLPRELNESGKYDSVRKRFLQMDPKMQGQEMKKLGAAPVWTIGSVHAVTEDGKALIASATGSQLPAYVYGAGHVIWIVGAQKIVKNTDEGMKRIYEYVLPLEDERARKAYGQGSGVNKLLIVNKEVTPGRVTMIIVKEKLGF